MARIRILQGVSGLDFSWAPGDVVDLDDDAAALWADGYRAQYDDTPPTPAPDDQAPAADPDPESPGPDDTPVFDPGEHPVKDVVAYLEGDTVTAEETARVLDAEAAGQDRKGISGQRDTLLQQAAARDTRRAQVPPAEVAADDSRGGGRGDTPETR